jgi:filamentous hemagglutinin family protein
MAALAFGLSSLGLSLAAPAIGQTTPPPFNTMVGMQAGRVIGTNGQLSQWTGAKTPVIGTDAGGRPLMTIEQTQAKALLDWEDFRLQAGEVLEFQQQAADWIAVNRVHGTQAAEINGEIRAPGRVFVFNDNGVLIGKDASINVRQLVTGKGVSDVLVDGATTTIVQSQERATLDWNNMNLDAGQVLKFKQEQKDWIALNRSYSTDKTFLAGDITADGNIYLVAPKGLVVDGKITAQQVILSSLYMRDDQFAQGLNSYARDYNNRMDPTFSNTWDYTWDYGNSSYTNLGKPAPEAADPNDPLKYNVTISRTGSVTTGEHGKVMLFGPKVNNKGLINVSDEGQVVLAAGENIYLTGAGGNGMVSAYAGAYNPLDFMRINIPYSRPPQTVPDAEWQAFYQAVLGKHYEIGETVPDAEWLSLNGYGGGIETYLNNMQAERAREIGYVARNEGIITAKRGGNVSFVGLNLEQMGAIDMTSTALFRGDISFRAVIYDYREYPNGDADGPLVPGNGTVVFGKGSLTQITPDLDSKDTIAVSSGPQSVGTLKINAGKVSLEEDSLIYMPSGTMNVLLDAGRFVLGGNRGAGANQGNEDGTRFMMDKGATIDLSGWKETVLEMGFHQVTGKLFAAQLSDSPMQQGGPLARKEITVDRRYGTALANWESFDNLSNGTLAQFLINGGSLNMDIGNDFIMKSGSVIDVSGGVTTYEAGYVYTTLLRRLDGTVIDIREADPDELYMGLANEWTQYDTKWGKQETYYIPLISSVQGKYETSYQQGGKGGAINILAPDVVLQGTLKGETVSGRYQRGNAPAGGTFTLNDAGESEGEYVSNNVLISAIEHALSDNFKFDERLTDTYGDLFGDEFDPATDPVSSDDRHYGNTTLTSADFFNRSTMGSYSITQRGRVELVQPFPASPGVAVMVEAGANINLQDGGSLKLVADERLSFLGSVRTEGGNVSLSGMALTLGADTKIDTRGSWYSDYELDEPVALGNTPRINGGSISLLSSGDIGGEHSVGLILPGTAKLDTSGGAWVDRTGKIKGGKGGNISITAYMSESDNVLDLGGLDTARAYGLGGNGALSLTLSSAIFIGDSLPSVEEDPNAGIGIPFGENYSGPVGAPVLLSPDIFANSGFSSISLMSPIVTVTDGTQVHAGSATLQLKDASLVNGVPAAFFAPSGSDIYDVAEIVHLTPEQRPSALRNGMSLAFTGQGITIGEGSLVSTETGGSITLSGSSYVAGALSAAAGAIKLNADQGFVHVASTGRLLAPGAVLITSRKVSNDGRELIDGEVRNGGNITLNGNVLMLDEGSVIDVSGTSAMLDIPTTSAGGLSIRTPTLVTSNGGSISITGSALSIDDATYHADAGGAGARGGSFSLSWGAGFAPPSGGQSPLDAVNTLDQYFQWGYAVNKDDFTPYTTLYGTDLSQVMWENFVGYPIDFPPGFTVNTPEDVATVFNDYVTAALGAPPMLVIGDKIPVSTEPTVLPVINPGLVQLFAGIGYTLPTPNTGAPAITQLSPGKISDGGFSSLNIDATPGIIFSGTVDLGGKKADGSYIFDTITLNSTRIMGRNGADVHLEAGIVNLENAGASTGGNNLDLDAYMSAITAYDVYPISADTRISISAGTLLQVGSADFYGFDRTTLNSHGDIRLSGVTPVGGVMAHPVGNLNTTGLLAMKADQIYAGTGRVFTVTAGTGIDILAQDDGGPINGTPYEAGAQLTLKAPRITQGGTLRSPLGTLTLETYDDGSEGADILTLKAGSLTSVSADGHTIPYGYTSNGDTWIDPFTGLELTTLPTKAINLTSDAIDMQAGSVVDVSGGGDLYAREFVPGVGGTKDWLTGYRDGDNNWVSAPGEIYAVVPDYEGNIAPLGFGASQIGIGDKVYLSGGSGLRAGYYTLLPAEYALLPGAYRVTTHSRVSGTTDMALGQSWQQTDGSSVQAGYLVSGASGAQDQRTHGFLVMPGETLRMRSFYRETTANTFFASDAFIKKALRVNRPLTDLPRIPLDGGSVVLKAGHTLNLEGTLKSAAGKDGRGGFADIASSKIVVSGANTDLSQYDGYLVLKSDQLNNFGAESLLIGGTRHQGAINLELAVSGTDIVVDNAGSVLAAPELLFASTGRIDVLGGSKVETRGQISGSSGDLRIVPAYDKVVDNNGTDWTTDDDILVNGILDQGAVLRISSGEQVDILRDGNAVDAMTALLADPAALALANSRRAAMGLAPIAAGGVLTINEGSSITSGRSVALDATDNTYLRTGAIIDTRQLSASASLISIGQTPAGTTGLVFTNGSLDTLARAEDLTLKSYSSIDIYGDVTLKSTDALTLDTRNVRVVGTAGNNTTLSAKSLTLTNSNGGTAATAAGTASLTLDATNVYFAGGDKWLSGIDRMTIKAGERVIGRNDGTLFLPGALSIQAGGLTTESGARLFLDATGDVDVAYNGNASLPIFQSFGGTLGLTGTSVNYAGQTRMTGGTLTLNARLGDVVLGQGSVLDVTSDVSQIFDKAEGVGAGTINLVADRGNVDMKTGSFIDVSGSTAGGDAGTLAVRTGLGEARLGGTIKGTAADGYRSGAFSLLTRSMNDLQAFNSVLDAGGFLQSRRFEINSGDVTVNGTVKVQDFAVVANDGDIQVAGTIETTGTNGGRIQLSAANDVVLTSGGRLIARATAADGAGGTVLLETDGRDGGAITTEAGAQIDVSGTGEGGRLVRFRAPQRGNDIAITSLDGAITGARSVIAEGYRVYDGVSTIDQALIDMVSDDATGFMNANAATIRNRLGGGVTLTAGIELRSPGDMELKQDWDLSALRFDSAAGILTLRAGGDLLINANLSDGFSNGKLMDGESWGLNLTAGANTDSPDSMAVLPVGLLPGGKGAVIVGGTADTIEYYYDPAHGNENRLYVIDSEGHYARDVNEPNYHIGFIELQRDPVTGKYIDPRTGGLIEKDPVTGDYADTGYYARRALPWIVYTSGGGYYGELQDGSLGYANFNGLNETDADLRPFQQWDNATGYRVRTGTGAINIASARDLVLKERPSVIYTAGRDAGALSGFWSPADAEYGQGGGDINLRIAGNIISTSRSPQLPSGYMMQRGTLDTISGTFTPATDRPYDQTTWWVKYDNFQGGIGALGGGNIDIDAGGDLKNVSVAIPNSGRVSGNTVPNEALVLTATGGGDLTLRAGGNIEGGAFYVADGLGDLTAGGSILSGSQVHYAAASYCSSGCDVTADLRLTDADFDLYSMFFTSSGRFNIKSGGDLNIDGVMDPLLLGTSGYQDWKFTSFTNEASVRLFSAGGDVNVWNNGMNVSLAYVASGSTYANRALAPLQYYGTNERPDGGRDSIAWDLRPANFTAVAAAGDVRVLGGMILMPSATGNLELLAGNNVYIGYGTQALDPFLTQFGQPDESRNYRAAYQGLYMSQAEMDLIRTPTNQPLTSGGSVGRVGFFYAGAGQTYPGITPFSQDHLPDLHVGDTTPSRIYAAKGDVITSTQAELIIPKQLWLQAGGNIYFPSYTLQHNNPTDFSIVRAGEGIYFDVNVGSGDPGNVGYTPVFGHITLSGPGRLEIEAGTDIWMPSNARGITSQRIQIYANPGSSYQSPSGLGDWHPDQDAADIAISTGFNQNPSYGAFEDAYLSPEKIADMADYLKDDSGKSLYLFDREYKRADGATGEFAVPEPRQGLVNYVRQLQGLDPLKTKAEQEAYLDTAWTVWKSLATDYKTPFYRDVLFLELRTTGREANDPKNDRYNTTFRGYKAIEVLFPGAQKPDDAQLTKGESHWKGDFETYASRVISAGGGDVEFVIPGGMMQLANVAASPGETGQPAYEGDRGNALRAGVVTTDGGEVNIFAHDSVVLNESRILTTKGGNVLVWSSYGDIAAGKGAKTSISPQFFNYGLSPWEQMDREPAGLPTGAGIGTLATQEGVPPADVDLIAPAGIVDAGDAGIRVSGNFNVFAIEILGTDNIDVGGVSTGLPVPPAAPPTSLDTDVTDKSNTVDKAMDDAIKQVKKNNSIVSPSLIEVRVTGYGDDCAPGSDNPNCTPEEAPVTENKGGTAQSGRSTSLSMADSLAPANLVGFSIPAQQLDDAVRAIGRTSGTNILYDPAILEKRMAPPLSGKMSPEKALEHLLTGQNLEPVRVGPHTIMLKKMQG